MIRSVSCKIFSPRFSRSLGYQLMILINHPKSLLCCFHQCKSSISIFLRDLCKPFWNVRNAQYMYGGTLFGSFTILSDYLQEREWKTIYPSSESQTGKQNNHPHMSSRQGKDFAFNLCGSVLNCKNYKSIMAKSTRDGQYTLWATLKNKMTVWQ